ncbi:uncharacterized protein HD556DRAFT_1304893 [Suillus plorans]|uniref:Uncharacterized protein n=1 Tax=Suillus plorans TaxID=116603 RepID=A0A9P7DR20_9AGAM|nr:uncharacterized protein HD556DRAFT_1304893 [Suillus plorans]KAG1800910.1 hypothetical protein HD556DRAFT_1304893 [Suillus plorans]
MREVGSFAGVMRQQLLVTTRNKCVRPEGFALYKKEDSPKRGKQSPKVKTLGPMFSGFGLAGYVGLRRISIGNVTNFEDSECVSDKERMIFAEFNEELRISNDLLLLGGRKVNNVSDVKTDDCTPSGVRYDRTGHREDKCAGKYRVRCAGNVGSVGLASDYVGLVSG